MRTISLSFAILILALSIVELFVILILLTKMKSGGKRIKGTGQQARKKPGSSGILSEADRTVYQVWGNKLDLFYQTQKPFLQPNLELKNVSRDVGTNRTYVSNIVNMEGMSFSEYNNACRTKEIIMLYLSNPDASFDELYKQAGFASYATFSRAFCKFVGQTPKRWVKEVEQMKQEKGTIDK